MELKGKHCQSSVSEVLNNSSNIGRPIKIQGNKKMGVNRLKSVQKATYFLKIKSGKK